MLFQGSLTIPPNTTKEEAVTTTFPIRRGIVSKFMVRPRTGHAALAHLIILHHEHQIAPSIENTDLHGDTFPVDWEDYYELYQPPYELKLIGWNDDDTYEHTFDVFVAVLPRKAVIVTAIADIFANFLDRVASLFGVFFPRKIPVEDEEGG